MGECERGRERESVRGSRRGGREERKSGRGEKWILDSFADLFRVHRIAFQ